MEDADRVGDTAEKLARNDRNDLRLALMHALLKVQDVN